MAVKTDVITCPVCGYGPLSPPAWTERSNGSQEMCPSCGIQFGYDDSAGGDEARRAKIYEERRQKWVAGGTRWFSRGRPPPPDWDPVAQLRRVTVRSVG